MIQTLPRADIIRCYFEETFGPHMPAMALRWPTDAGEEDQEWHLPEGVTIRGPAPARFGITVHRAGPNAYSLRLLWNECCFVWRSLERRHLLTSDLVVLLQALGTDLWHMLNQPIEPEAFSPPPAA